MLKSYNNNNDFILTLFKWFQIDFMIFHFPSLTILCFFAEYAEKKNLIGQIKNGYFLRKCLKVSSIRQIFLLTCQEKYVSLDTFFFIITKKMHSIEHAFPDISTRKFV